MTITIDEELTLVSNPKPKELLQALGIDYQHGINKHQQWKAIINGKASIIGLNYGVGRHCNTLYINITYNASWLAHTIRGRVQDNTWVKA